MRALVITAAAVLGGAVALLSGGTAAGAACPTPPASQAKPWLDPAYSG